MPLNEDFDKNLLKKIHDDHLLFKPRWKFLLKEYTIWIFSVILIAIGGLAISVIIYLIRNSDWDVYSSISGNIIFFIFLILPYVWIILLILFIASAQYYIKHTKKGYKHRVWIIVIGTVAISMVLGIVLYKFEFAEIIDEAMLERIPYYGQFSGHPVGRWQHPETGILAGEITDFDESDIFELNDIKGNPWKVSGKNSADIKIPFFVIGLRIRLIGRQTGDNNFHADRIMPALPPLDRFFRNRMDGPSHIPPPRNSMKNAVPDGNNME